MGTTKQAVHQSKQRFSQFSNELPCVLNEVDYIRKEHPGCGLEKAYKTILPKTMGRDKFIEIFMDLGYRVKHMKNYVKTTTPGHLKYPNLISRVAVNAPYQVVQSDITYYRVGESFYYITFIIDVYTKEILSHVVGKTLRTEANLKVLNIMLRKLKGKYTKLIHHSDRGVQYTSDAYRTKLEKAGIQISMGLTATDNAYAERINGIIKNEYLKYKQPKSFNELKHQLNKAVHHHNNKRKHRAFKMHYSPIEFRNKMLNLPPQNRPVEVIYAEQNSHIKRQLKPLDLSYKESIKELCCPINI